MECLGDGLLSGAFNGQASHRLVPPLARNHRPMGRWDPAFRVHPGPAQRTAVQQLAADCAGSERATLACLERFAFAFRKTGNEAV